LKKGPKKNHRRKKTLEKRRSGKKGKKRLKVVRIRAY